MAARHRTNARPVAPRRIDSGRWMRPKLVWRPGNSQATVLSGRATTSTSRTRGASGCWPSSTLRSSRLITERTGKRYPIYTGDAQWFSDNIPCMTACPSHTDISRYIALIADGRYAD